MPENPSHNCLVCNHNKHVSGRQDFRHRGEYLSTHLADGVDYTFTICDDCILGWHASGLLHEDDDFNLSCAMCQRSCSAPGGHDTTLGVVFTAFLPEGAEDVRLCEGCLVGLFDAAEPEAKPGMFCTIDGVSMSWTKYNWDGSEKRMDAVVGAPEMKIEPIALKIVIKPAEAGVKEKTMEKKVTGNVVLITHGTPDTRIELSDYRRVLVRASQWEGIRNECGLFSVGNGVETTFYLDDTDMVYAWHPKDPLYGLLWVTDYNKEDGFGTFEMYEDASRHFRSEHKVLFRMDGGGRAAVYVKHIDQAERRFGKLVPGRRYEWLMTDHSGTDIVGWLEAPLAAEAPKADTVSEPKDPMAGIAYRKGGEVPLRFGIVSFVAGGVVHLSKTTSKSGDSWSCYDYPEVCKRCGELVPGKSYQFFFATKDWDLVGWKEAPIPDDLPVYHQGQRLNNDSEADTKEPASSAPAAKLSDPPMMAMRFMAKRLGVRLPDDVASVGHATNVIEDALGAKIQQAMADTGFGVVHDIVRALGIDLDDRQGEPLGSYRHRVQAAIQGKAAQARLEGRDDGVNEVLAALEDQIQDSERQRKMLVEQLDRVNAHRITLQQVHADARKMRRGGAS